MITFNPHHVELFLQNHGDNFDSLERGMPLEISCVSAHSLYTRKSVRRIIEFLRGLSIVPKTIIQLEESGRPDSLCQLCDNYDVKNNVCRENPFPYEQLRDEDERLLGELRLGKKEFSVQELIDYRNNQNL